MKSNLQLIEECDNFPYPTPLTPNQASDPPPQSDFESTLYHLRIPPSPHTYGYLLPSTVNAMPWTPSFRITAHTVEILPPPPSSSPSNPSSSSTNAAHITTALSTLLSLARHRKTFQILSGWRNELYPLHGAPGVTIERAASALFGILTTGVHMTVYTRSPTAGLKIWVPRRAATKQTYPGMLDNSVAGGITAGETPFNSIVREAAEEASLPEALVRGKARACGMVSYFHIRDARAGGETGLLQPEVQYVYDMEVGADVELKPADEEVQEFYLWGVEEVRRALGEGRFKPNCAVVLMDFLVRHGVLTGENEGDYVEICARLRRRLPFPMGGGGEGGGGGGGG
ncbi:hypothetical protein MMC30_009148 [Trapelia coarctata]|nr:hypothetical protein [Trapelia coarctata]